MDIKTFFEQTAAETAATIPEGDEYSGTCILSIVMIPTETGVKSLNRIEVNCNSTTIVAFGLAIAARLNEVAADVGISAREFLKEAERLAAKDGV